MNAVVISHTPIARWSVRLIGAAYLFANMFTPALGAPPLTITAPANSTPVAPGQALAVTVAVASASALSPVAIIGQDPLGAAGPLAGSPVTFYLTIPRTTPPGTYSIAAAATNASGTLVTSAPVTVDVERADAATSLSVQPTAVNFRFVGDTLPLSVTGTFTGGIQVDLTRSSQLASTSENTGVATVQNGMITAMGAGQTNVDVRYGPKLVKALVTVPTSIRGDLNGDGRVDQSDLNIILAALNTPATGPFDARDLNGDGVINALDAGILVTLCTFPGCAGGSGLVPSAAPLLVVLLTEVTGVGPGKSLANTVELAQTYYAANNVPATCAALAGFVDEVKAQNGKKIATALDATIVADTQAIETGIPCN